MRIKKMSSPNRDNIEIPVEFLLIHYTAVDLNETLAIFMDEDAEVSAHLVIDTDGTVYELVDCLNGKALRARHAGAGYWQENDTRWETFNNFSIGIELINYNGNLFSYTDQQYQSLISLIKKLQKHYISLTNPDRLLGHEHIACFRGKADPGKCFSWEKLAKNCFKTPPSNWHRAAVCPDNLSQVFAHFKQFEPTEPDGRSDYWKTVSLITESTIKLLYSSANKNNDSGII